MASNFHRPHRSGSYRDWQSSEHAPVARDGWNATNVSKPAAMRARIVFRFLMEDTPSEDRRSRGVWRLTPTALPFLVDFPCRKRYVARPSVTMQFAAHILS